MEKKIIPEVNRSVFEIIENLDAAPDKARPVTFWLYSGSEGNLYRAAGQLQKTGYLINYCGPAACSDPSGRLPIQRNPAMTFLTAKSAKGSWFIYPGLHSKNHGRKYKSQVQENSLKQFFALLACSDTSERFPLTKPSLTIFNREGR